MANKFLSNINLTAGLEADGQPGTSGQVLSSTGTGVSWINPETISSESAEHVQVLVKNTSGATIAKGTPVYVTGETGNSGKIEIAPADASDSAKMPALGLLLTALNNNGEGYCVSGGLLEGLATATIDGASSTANDTVYVKAGGGLTLTKPSGAANLIQNVAKVARVHASNGSFIVSSILRTNDVPNLNTGKIWVGDGNTTESTVVHLDETNGRMGIGTTSPDSKLDISDTSPIITINATATSAHGIEFKQNNTLDAFIKQTPSSGEFTFNVGRSTSWGGDFRFITDTYDSYRIQKDLHRFYTLGGEKMRITSGGNVGIGTTSPASPLHVNTGSGTSNANTVIIDRAGASDYSAISFATAGAVDWSVGHNSAGNFEVFENGSDATTRLTIETGGNVGIGTTSPTSKLHVDAAGSDTTAHFVSTDANARIQVSDSTDSLYIGVQSNKFYFGGDSSASTTNLILDSSGNVGIGTTSPAYKLDVSGDIRSTSQVRANTNIIAGGYIDVTGVINHRDDIKVLNKLATNWITWATRDTSGSDSVINLSNIKNITASGNLTVQGTTILDSLQMEASSDYITFYGGNSTQHSISSRQLNGAVGDDLRFNTYGSFIINLDSNNNQSSAANSSFYIARHGSASGDLSSNILFDIDGENGDATFTGDIRLSTNATYLRSKDSASATPRVLGMNASNTFYIGPIDSYSGGSILYGVSSSVNTQNFYTSGSERMRIHSNGNVGIGTTSPSHLLTLETASSPGLKIKDTTQGATLLAFSQDSNSHIGTYSSHPLVFDTNSAEKMRIDANGTIFIGNQSTAYQTVFLDPTPGTVYGNGTIQISPLTSPGSGVAQFTTNFADRVGGGTTKHNIRVGGAAQMQTGITEGIHYVGTGVEHWGDGGTGMSFPANDTVSLRTASSDRLYINSTGNVGIGTTAPVAKLHVLGTSSDNATTKAEMLSNSVFSVRPHSTNSGTLAIAQVDNGNSVGMQFTNGSGTSNWDISIQPFGGNVGIGTTSPSAKLDVNGTGMFRGNVDVYKSNAKITITSTGSTEQASIDIQNNSLYARWILDADDLFRVYNQTSGYNTFAIKSNGNVGIGTTAPLQPLSIESSTSPLIKIRNTTNAGGAAIEFNDNGSSASSQNGRIVYRHSDSQSQGGGSTFELLGEDDQTLQVLNNGRIVVQKTGSATEVGYGFYNDINTGMYSPGADTLALSTGGNNRLHINSSGNVGIGTTAPSQLLHVAGNMRLQNQLYDSTNSLGTNDQVLTKVSAGTQWKDAPVNAQMPNNTAPASAANVGTIRYRTTSNNSFVDISMQTGASTYAWVNIVSNFW